jgi:hypothetical protein
MVEFMLQGLASLAFWRLQFFDNYQSINGKVERKSSDDIAFGGLPSGNIGTLKKASSQPYLIVKLEMIAQKMERHLKSQSLV